MGTGGRFLRRRVHPRICVFSPRQLFAEFHTIARTLQQGALSDLCRIREDDAAHRIATVFGRLRRLVEWISALNQINPTHANSQALRRTCVVPAPYLRRTCVASSSDFVAKSEDEATQVLSWYDPGTEQVWRKRG